MHVHHLQKHTQHAAMPTKHWTNELMTTNNTASKKSSCHRWYLDSGQRKDAVLARVAFGLGSNARPEVANDVYLHMGSPDKQGNQNISALSGSAAYAACTLMPVAGFCRVGQQPQGWPASSAIIACRPANDQHAADMRNVCALASKMQNT